MMRAETLIRTRPREIHGLSNQTRLDDDWRTLWRPELVKFGLFAVAWLILGYATGQHIAIALLTAPVFALASLFLFNAWAAKREHRDAAWKAWVDRVLVITGRVETHPDYELISREWRAYFDDGYSPERAVSAHKAEKLT